MIICRRQRHDRAMLDARFSLLYFFAARTACDSGPTCIDKLATDMLHRITVTQL